MTPATLRSTLATMLASELGTYTVKAGTTTPAIWVGEPPSEYTATGLEVRIAEVPEFRQLAAFNRGAVTETHQVRLVSHGSTTNTTAAVRKILSRWSTAQAGPAVPANEATGRLHSVNITIPTTN